MNTTFVSPFVHSVQQVFEIMLQMPVREGDPFLKQDGEPSHDVSGIIGMSGDVSGSVALSFDTATAERVVSLMNGMKMEHTHEDFADTIGELVNMVAGGAKAQFDGKSVSITCPSVVIGAKHQVFSRKDIEHIVLPFDCDCGPFAVEISIRSDAAAGVVSSAGAAHA